MVQSAVIVSDHAFINGGQAKVAIESALGLAEAGIKTLFFAACGPADPRLQAAGIEVHCLNQHDILTEPDRLRGAARGIWNPAAAKALRAVLARQDPLSTIVHCHGFAKALSPSIGPVITRGPFAHVYTMHEYFLACPNGGFYDYQAHEICTRRPLGLSCLTTHCDVRHPAHKLWRVARQGALWSAGNMPRGLRDIIYISRTQLNAMAPYLPDGARLHHIPNPVDAPTGGRVHAEDNDIFLFVGRLNPEKGGLLFARAAKAAGVRAVFVGDGPEREAILAANPDAVITGWLSPDEVKAWMDRARCLVFPSLWYECQPLAPLEAMARGLPVMAGRWSAAAESVQDGVTGMILDSSRTEDWAQAFLKLNENVASLSRAAYETMTADAASRQSHIADLLDVYRGLLGRRHP